MAGPLLSLNPGKMAEPVPPLRLRAKLEVTQMTRMETKGLCREDYPN